MNPCLFSHRPSSTSFTVCVCRYAAAADFRHHGAVGSGISDWGSRAGQSHVRSAASAVWWHRRTGWLKSECVESAEFDGKVLLRILSTQLHCVIFVSVSISFCQCLNKSKKHIFWAYGIKLNIFHIQLLNIWNETWLTSSKYHLVFWLKILQQKWFSQLSIYGL